jgi:hypothetical protein
VHGGRHIQVTDRSFPKPTPHGGAAPHYGASLQQQRVDAIQAQVRKEEARKRLFKPASNPPQRPLEPTSDIISIRIAEELSYARRILDRLGEDLISNPVVVHRHAQSLQSFDLLNQLLGHLARVIETEDRAEAIERIGMQELRARLKRRPIAAFAALSEMDQAAPDAIDNPRSETNRAA